MQYAVSTCKPGALTTAERTVCLEIITEGGAVNPETAARDFPHAELVAIVRTGQEIAAVGVIKGPRPDYATVVAQRSGFAFDQNMLELGYVAVRQSHRNQGLSTRIFDALLSGYKGPLFATTSSEKMKHLNRKLGFIQRGNEWQGKKDRLSLWIR